MAPDKSTIEGKIMTEKDKFIKELKAIGWDVVDSYGGMNDFIITPEGERTNWRLLGDYIELTGDTNGMSVHLNYKDLFVLRSEDGFGTIGVGSQTTFVLFHNFKKG